MLYIGVSLSTTDRAMNFDASLPPAALAPGGDAHRLADLYEALGIRWVFTCPARRCLQTLQPYIARRKDTVGYLRCEVDFRLYPAANSDLYAPRQLTHADLAEFRLQPNDVDGIMSTVGETAAAVELRVHTYLQDHLVERYCTSPVPSLVMCDPLVASMILQRLMANTPDQANELVRRLKPGAVYEFGSDGFRLEFKRQVA